VIMVRSCSSAKIRQISWPRYFERM